MKETIYFLPLASSFLFWLGDTEELMRTDHWKVWSVVFLNVKKRILLTMSEIKSMSTQCLFIYHSTKQKNKKNNYMVMSEEEGGEKA